MSTAGRRALAGLCALLLTAEARAQEEIFLPRRTPLPCLIVSASQDAESTSSSELIRMASDVVEARTDFSLRVLDADAVRDCRGRLGCIARAVRSDYDREAYSLPNGTIAPYQDHLDALARRQTIYSRYLLVLSNVRLGSKDTLSATLVDTDRALALYHGAFRDREDWELETEARINEDAVVHEARGALTAPADARAFLVGFVEALAAPLGASGHWEPFGAVAIEAGGGASIRVDGELVGVAKDPTTHLRQVPAGAHTLRLETPDGRAHELSVQVSSLATTTVHASLTTADPAWSGPRRAVFWTGAALALGGGALTAVALAAGGGATTYCPTLGEPACEGRRFTRFGASDDAGFGGPQGGVPLAPIGYSLAATGATFALGTWLFGEADDLPWPQVVAGLALGGLSLGLSLALEADAP